eukprot:gene14146-21673_t
MTEEECLEALDISCKLHLLDAKTLESHYKEALRRHALNEMSNRNTSRDGDLSGSDVEAMYRINSAHQTLSQHLGVSTNDHMHAYKEAEVAQQAVYVDQQQRFITGFVYLSAAAIAGATAIIGLTMILFWSRGLTGYRVAKLSTRSSEVPVDPSKVEAIDGAMLGKALAAAYADMQDT